MNLLLKIKIKKSKKKSISEIILSPISIILLSVSRYLNLFGVNIETGVKILQSIF